jgi:hypothetical protein
MRRLLCLGILIACTEADAARMGRRTRGAPGVSDPFPVGPPIALTSPSPAGKRVCVIEMGQSTCLDSGSLSCLSTSQDFDNVESVGSGGGAALNPLECPTTGNDFESNLPGMCDQFSAETGIENLVCFAKCASGISITEMQAGSSLNNQVTNQANSAQAVLTGLGEDLECVAFMLTHSTTDQISTPQMSGAEYVTLAKTMIGGIQTRLGANAHPDGLTVFATQESAWTTTYDESDIPEAMWEESKRNPGRWIIPGPAYIGPWADQYHPSDVGHLARAQLNGKAMGAHFLEFAPIGLSWEPTRMTRVVATEDNTIEIYLRLPCKRYPSGDRCAGAGQAALAIDETLIGPRENHGIKYRDQNLIGVAPTIVSVAIPGTCGSCLPDEAMIEVTLTGQARTNTRISMGDFSEFGVGGACDPGEAFAPGCAAATNIRDTDNTAPQSGSATLYNWAIIDSEPVIGDTAEPVALPTIANSRGTEWSDNTENVLGPDFDEISTAMTVLAIVRPSGAFTNAQHIFSKWTPTTGEEWRLTTNTTGGNGLIFYVGSAGNFNRCTGAACAIATDVTTCIAVTYDGTMPDDQEVTIYTGLPGGSMSAPTQSISGDIPSTMPASTAPFRAGYSAGTLPGRHDEFAVLSIKLTPEQLSTWCANYSSSAKVDLMDWPGVSAAAVELWWGFEVGATPDTTTATDLSGNGRTGALTSGAAFSAAPAVP